MKTAEEWNKKYFLVLGDHDMGEQVIKLIQLDAVKEGMRRAANKAIHAGVYASDHAGCKVAAEAILSAAEQLTTKDL